MTLDLYNGDCLWLMHLVPSGSVDLVLCDLPYGTTQNKWDSVINFEAALGSVQADMQGRDSTHGGPAVHECSGDE